MMGTQWLLIIVLIISVLFLSTVRANLEHFPEVTYEDIERLNATCPGGDSCQEDRYFDDLDYYNCNCREFCKQFDTCCFDSQHRDKVRKIRKPYNCVKPYRTKTPYFTIDSCDSSWSGDNHTAEMCSANVEELEDLFLAVPVSSNETGITYRNYYCAVCNNETEKGVLTFWNLSLISKAGDIMTSPLPDLHFLSSRQIWIVGNDTEDIVKVTVNPSVKIPKKIKDLVHECVPNVISQCADDWNDTVVEDKCAAYMAIVRLRRGDLKTYRNPHCAICNHESFNKVSCSSTKNLIRQTVVPSNTFFVRLFSLYDKKNKCSDDEVYDTIAKKCRKVYKG